MKFIKSCQTEIGLTGPLAEVSFYFRRYVLYVSSRALLSDFREELHVQMTLPYE